MRRKIKNIHPGNKVRILEDAIYPLDDIGLEIRSTKGSQGTILSYEEYSAHIIELAKHGFGPPPDNVAAHLALIKSSMDAGTHYPIRFYEYVPLPEEEYAKLEQDWHLVYVSCQVGGISVLPTNSFVVLKE